MARLSRLSQPRLRASLGCPQGWQMISSTLRSWESMSKFTFTEFTISHSNASQFHTQVPDHLCQRGRSGVSSAYACRQEQGEMGEQPQNLTLFLNPLLSYVIIQGAHPTSYLLAVFSLFAPGVDLLGKCVLQLVQTLLSNQTGARRPGQLWTTFWPSTGTGLG